MLKYIYFFITFLISSQTLWSQYYAKGQVFENGTNEPIPFVNITALPSGEGTTTDFDGNFEFSSTKKISSLTFSFIGYETQKHKTNGSREEALNITLFTSDIKIDETVVVAKRIKKIPVDTPAVTLYRNVVKNKEDNKPKGLDSYHYKEHSKIEFDLYKYSPKFETRFYMKPFKFAFEHQDSTESGNLILPGLLQEELTEVYYNKDPEKNKKIIIASLATGIENMSANLVLGNYLVRVDMYDNVIDVGGKSFSSPFSPGGILTYRFFLSDSTTTPEGVTLYRLDFSPRNKHSIAFNGYAWIENENFAITEMEFRVPRKANLNFINDFYVRQTFTKPNGENWFLTAEEMHVAFNPLKNKKGRSLLLKKRINRNEIKLNYSIDDTIFKGEALIIEDSVTNRSSEWWAENRVAPLTQTEKDIFTVVDSMKNTRVYRDINRIIYFGTSGYLRVGKKVPFEFGQLYKFFSWNNVEGIRLKFGGRTNKFLSKKYLITAYGAYGLKDKQWKGLASLRLMLPQTNHRWHTLEFSYVNDFTFLGATNSEQKFNHDNLFLALLRRGPLTKIMRIEDYSVNYEKEWVYGFSTVLTGSRKTYFAIKNTFDFDRINAQGNIESFPKFSTTEIGITAKIEFGKHYFKNDYYRVKAGSRKPQVEISYALGIEDALGGEHGFHKFRLKYFHRWTHKLGFTKYQIRAGYILGEAPYPLMFMHQGNNNFYYSSSAYSNMGEFEYASDRYAAFWLDHHFDGTILNTIPLIKHLKLRSIFLFKMLVGDISPANKDLILMPASMGSTFQEKEKIYAEMGFGIENILKVLRVEFMWRLTQRKTQFEGQDVQKFAVKFAFQPKF